MDKQDDLNGMIEIHDEQIDAQDIVHRIRANIHTRHEVAQAQGLDFDAFVEGQYPEGKRHFDKVVYHNLRRANATYDGITVKKYVSPRSVPLVGKLVQRLRGVAHDLVIYYVNMLGSRQMLFNGALVHLLNSLMEGLEQDAAHNAQELAALQAQVRALRAQVAELQQARGVISDHVED